MTSVHRPTPKVLAVVLALALAPLAYHASAPAAEDDAALTFKRLIDSGTAGAAQPFHAFDTHAANAFDLDGDGRLELVSQNDNHRVYVLDPESGKLLAEIYNGLPKWWGARDENGVAIGDVNGNGKIDLVIVNSAGTITVQELQSVDAHGKFVFEKLWSVTPDPHWIDPHYEVPDAYNEGNWSGYPSADGPAYLADVEGNGKLWVFMQADGTAGHYAFDHTGKFRWGTLWGDGNAPPIVKDIDADGALEVVYVTDGGRILAYDARSGHQEWNWKTGVWPGSMPVDPAVVDLDGDGKMEIITGGRGVEVVPGTAPGGDRTKAEPDLENSHATFVALNHDGTVRWEIRPGFANPLMYMTPRTFDVNGDGVLDVIFLDWNTIGHKPGNWNYTGHANLFAVDGRDGGVLWQTGVNSVWSNKGVVLVDVDGDGNPEVLAEHQDWRDGIAWYDVYSGKMEGWVPFPDGHWVASRGPLAVDVEKDGRVEIVVPIMRNAPYEHCEGARHNLGCREGAFVVYEAREGSKVWDGANSPFNHELEDEVNLPGAVPVPREEPAPDPEPEPDTNVTHNETNATDNMTNETNETNDSDPNEASFSPPDGTGGGDPPSTGTGSWLPTPGTHALAVLGVLAGVAACASAGRRRP